MQDLIHRMNQTAHISLQILAISKSVETKSTVCALSSLARPASFTSDFRFRLVAVWPVWRPVVRLSAACEGVFTSNYQTLQPLFSGNVIFFS